MAQDAPFSETIVVTGRTEKPGDLAFETRHSLAPGEVDVLGASSANEIIRRIPGVHLPVNSRGEAIAFVRNAGERQVAIYYEGAAINVPWDNRLDLALFPAALIGSVRSAAGPLAPHYGVNAIAALSLSPRTSLHALAAMGTHNLVQGEAVVALAPAVIGASYSARDGEALSGSANLPFSQPGGEIRTNTDHQLASVFGRVAVSAGAHDLSLTAIHVTGEKGIAPEGNRATGGRFWRYPELRHTLIVGSANSSLGDVTEISSTLWHQRFGQTIENYANASYDRITLRQTDRDATWGLRELLKHRAGLATLVGSFNLLDSVHRQRDVPFTAGGAPPILPAELVYRQRNWSLGAELELELSQGLRAELGGGYDRVDYLQTGDKPPVAAAAGWTGRLGLAFDAGEGFMLHAAAGRKMRAPTLRERFGEAINRFLISPDLRPEQITTYEAGIEWKAERGGAFLIPFHQKLKDTIDQRNVGPLRQRINLAGSTVWGVEFGGEWRPLTGLKLSGNGTWTRVRRKDAPAGELNRIAEKPSLLARARLDYDDPSGVSAAVEAEHTGRAYSADPAGTLVPLARSTSLNARLAYATRAASNRLEMFVQAENLTDALIERQLGLPAPGRSVRVGIRLE